MGLLELIFGSTGQGTLIAGGAWHYIAFFILTFFVLMLVSQGVSTENILWFVLAFFLIILQYGLFNTMPISWIVTPIIVIILFVAFIAFNIFNK